MNDRYTYGYGLGWNIENEYINSLSTILEAYNIQSKKINDISVSRSIIENMLEKTISEEEIRNSYNEFYSDSLRSYEAFRQDVLNEEIRRKEGLRLDLERNKDEYLANLYYLIEIKHKTRQEINQKRKELTLLLEERELELSVINLNVRKSLNGNDSDFEQRRRLNGEYDQTFLEVKKLRHALENLDQMSKSMEFSEEEQSLMLSGLNPRARMIYDQLDKGLLDDDLSKTKQKRRDNNTVDDDETPEKDDDETPEKDDDDDDLDLTIDISEYEQALKKYEELLRIYNEELKNLYELQEKYEKGEIEYEEYENYANYMIERYKFVLEEYIKLITLKEKYEKLLEAKNEELMQKLDKLEADYHNIYHFYVHKANGEIPAEDEVKLAQIQEKINKIKEELERRKNLLKEPIPPEKPVKIEKIKKGTRENNNYLEELLAKIGYGGEEEKDELYGPLDNFVYKNKDIKVWNFPKSKARTFLDKPFKLVKASIGGLVFGVQKIFSNAKYKNSEELRNRIDRALERVNNLTDEEIDFLAEHLTYRSFKELGSSIPKIVFNAIKNKIREKYNGRYLIESNLKIQKMYETIINKYKECAEIQEKLKQPGLSKEEIKKLQEQFNRYSNELCDDINDLMDFRAEVDQKINLSGAASLDYNNKAKFNTSAGGYNVSKKVQQEYNFFWKRTHISKFLDRRDGFNAAKRMLYGEKLKIANTEEKRTLKNRFGKARAGAYEFSPFVTIADYSENTYLKDVLATIAIISSIGNIMYMKKLKADLAQTKQQLAQANAQISAYNNNITANNAALQNLQNQIAQLTNSQNVTQQQINQLLQQINTTNQTILSNNQVIQDLQNILSLYTTNPDLFVDKMIKFVEQTIGTDHGYAEYLMMTGDAAGKGTAMLMSEGPIYNMFDQSLHNDYAKFLADLYKIKNNTSLSAAAKATQIANIFTNSNGSLSGLINTLKTQAFSYISSYGNNWDLSAFEAVMNNVAVYDPTFVSDVFTGFVDAALKANQLQTLQTLTTTLNLPAINLNVPNPLPLIQSLTVNIPSVDLVPAIATCASIVGKEGCDAIVENIANAERNAIKEKGYSIEEKTNEMTDELAKKISDIPIDMEEIAKSNYDEAKREWDSKSAFYRFFHKKEKPKNLDYYIDALKEENKKGGYSL